MAPSVRISEIGLYLRCPRQVYFESLKSMPRRIDPAALLLKSLMLSISSRDNLDNQLREGLERLESELPLVYEIDPEELQSACMDLEKDIGGIARSLEESIDLLHPFEAEVDLHSKRLGLSGRLDRLAPGRVPSIIRTGNAPEEGVWKRDRIMLAGYALLLGEQENRHIDHGMVEYSRLGLVRRIDIHGIDRARALRLRDRIRQIKDGRLPDRPEDAPCRSCWASDNCQTRHSLASRFF
jgi:CRISPR-associated exonuclease Cas4